MPSLDEFRRTNKGGENDGVYAEFFMGAILNQHLSQEAGRPIYQDREMVKIVLSGDNKSEVVREALPKDKARFERQYAAFKARTDQISANGTPLSQWPVMTPAMVRNFAGMSIFTVEQLAGMPDSALQSVGMGGREWKTRAAAFLDQAQEGAATQKLASENERLLMEVDSLRRQIADLSARLEREREKSDDDGEYESPPRRRGRPPKAEPMQPVAEPRMPTVIG